MPQIQLNYLYRDGSNYKYWGEVILPNPDNLSLEEMDVAIRSQLIYETWFYHRDFNVPDLRPRCGLDDDDPTGTSSTAFNTPSKCPIWAKNRTVFYRFHLLFGSFFHRNHQKPAGLVLKTEQKPVPNTSFGLKMPVLESKY